MFSKEIELDEKIIIKNRIPILVRDENWIELFYDVDDKDIQLARKELDALLEEEDNIEKELRDLQIQKIKDMKMILKVSDAVNNEDKVESVELLDSYKKNILEINDSIDEITFRLETIPKEILEANFNLLKATVNYGYKELKIKEKKLDATSNEVEELKSRLKDLINEKHDYEEWINATYTFLHGLLGNVQMEELDNKILEK